MAEEIYPYLVGVLDNIGCPSLQVGGAAHQGHMFFHLVRTKSVSEIVKTLKTSLCKWIKSKGPEFAGFHWQAGYGAFSVSQSDSDAVVAYVRN